MTPISKKAQKILDYLTRELEPGDSRKIDNAQGTFMAVHVSRIADDVYTVVHYYEQCGDLMCDPEIAYWRGPDQKFYPISYRQDGLGVYQESVVFEAGVPAKVAPAVQRDQAQFTTLWMTNIVQQQDLDMRKMGKPTVAGAAP